MHYIIENEFLQVKINAKGAEIASVINKATGDEMIWCADPTVWGRHAPILFPYCGRLLNGKFTKDGIEYEGNPHGFARDLDHILVEKSDTSVKLILEANVLTMEKFPYAFGLISTYELSEKTLHHTVAVVNDSDESMPFGFGYHPAFVCPFDKEHATTDYDVVFDTPQSPIVLECDAVSGLITNKEYTYFESGDTIQLNDTFFDGGSICFKGLTCETMTLKERGTDKKITLNVKDYPYVLLWSTPGEMKFLCIEPWHTLPDAVDTSGEWADKKPNIELAPEERWSTSLAMTFDR